MIHYIKYSWKLIKTTYSVITIFLQCIWEFIKGLFTPIAYIYYYGRAFKKAHNITNNDITKSDYTQLSIDILQNRLKEEHLRSQKIDDKTIKFNFSISFAITIISTLFAYLSLTKSNYCVYIIPQILLYISVVYSFISGIISLGAIKTLPMFGIATSFYFKIDTKSLSKALLGQEKINTCRHIRNECAYQCIITSLVFLIFGLVWLLVYL